jgi:hypothetical protein
MQIHTPIAPINLVLLQRRGFAAMPRNSKACQAAVRRLGRQASLPARPTYRNHATASFAKGLAQKRWRSSSSPVEDWAGVAMAGDDLGCERMAGWVVSHTSG